MDIKFINDKQIEITSKFKPKKITGTRLASILGLDKWNTPFKTWCAITKVYEEPFTDSIYTIAGKTIEPKVFDYLNKTMFFGDIKTPEDVYGKDFFSKTFGDFYKDEPIFGGMWDALVPSEKTVIEVKTTKRSEDWKDGIPIYYAIQAALYARNLGWDNVLMVVSFLEDKDYEHPENFVPNSKNTLAIDFKVSETFPDFEATLKSAELWWETHVVGKISPEFAKADAEIIKVLKTKTVSASDAGMAEVDLAALMMEAEEIQNRLEPICDAIEVDEKRLKEINEQIKALSKSKMAEGENKVVIEGQKYFWETSVSMVAKVDSDKMKADGIYDKYATKAPQYKISMKVRK